jgi:hypothetical protein
MLLYRKTLSQKKGLSDWDRFDPLAQHDHAALLFLFIRTGQFEQVQHLFDPHETPYYLALVA